MKKVIEMKQSKHLYYQENHPQLLLVFGGVGYTSDKPLLYYGIQCALQNGYDVCVFDYGQYPFDKNHPLNYVEAATKNVQKMMEQIDFSQYDKVCCLAKSIGTVIASFMRQEEWPAFMLTPIKEVLLKTPVKKDVYICASQDPMVEKEHIDLFKKSGVKVFLLEGNHSIETKCLRKDLEQLQVIMELFDDFLVK